jgi:methylated-DNA-[protein]-cysteine S-methyltransferase
MTAPHPGTVPYGAIRGTAFGPLTVVWIPGPARPGIVRVFLSNPKEPSDRIARTVFPSLVPDSCAEVDAVVDQMKAFLDGDKVRLPLALARLDLCHAFQRSVLAAERTIPAGRVSTYQRIARFLGRPTAARAVGTALAHNPFPLLIPCHRAVRSDGAVGGFQGGPAMKRLLLEREGVAFDDRGRVSDKRFYHKFPKQPAPRRGSRGE